ncbi:MAG: NAD(P)H-quinone oxidoreductase [Hyphomicrobiales bacterium]|nr:NAD(P)H-quinone oxidoreductase [Hyphomicrobiales bacterium]MDE2017408.1 NAD(P)H-quinone oxidoreductase [Hyphomicrobiales bacterium]
MTLPSTMRAVAISKPGGPEVLVAETRAVPSPGAGEILVRVRAAGVNRPDALQRQGAYPPPPGASDLPGLEVAGEVAAIGAGVARWKVGDAVTALTPGGGYAQYALAPAGHALPVPHGFDMVQAAVLPETFFTVWVNVFERAGLKAGETLLVHGGGSGIGVTATLLGKAFGARVIVTAGGPERCASCRAVGADAAIDHRAEDFVAATREATGGRGADVILDMVGGDYVSRNYLAAAEGGRIAQIAFLHGPKAEVDLRPLMMKRLVHTGSTLRPRTIAEKAAIARALEEKVWPLLSAGRCKPPIDSVFPLDEASRAHARMESGAHFGKIALAVS